MYVLHYFSNKIMAKLLQKYRIGIANPKKFKQKSKCAWTGLVLADASEIRGSISPNLY